MILKNIFLIVIFILSQFCLTGQDIKTYKQFGLCGYKSHKGDVITPAKFMYCADFEDGLAIVAEDDGWGMIDRKGEYIMPAKYKRLDKINSNLLIYTLKNSQGTSERYSKGLISSKGEVLTLGEYEKYHINKSYVAVAGRSKEVKGKTYFESEIFTCNGNRIVEKGLYQFTFFNTDFMYVQDTNRLSRMFDTKFKSKEIKVDDLDRINQFSGSLAVYKSGEKFGYIKKDGTLLTKPLFNFARKFLDGLAIVSFDNKYGLINTKGRYIIKPQYYNLELPYQNQLVASVDLGSRINTIIVNMQGEVLTGSDCDDSMSQYKGITFLKCGNHWYLYNYITKSIEEEKFDDIRLCEAFELQDALSSYEINRRYSKSMAYVKVGESWKVIDEHGKTIIPFSSIHTLNVSIRKFLDGDK